MVVLTEDPPPQVERKKETLDMFWRLSNAKNEKNRIEAASKVLQSVANSSLDPAYTMTRLVRGLASSSPLARQGFFVCLSEFLRQTSTSHTQVLRVVEDDLKPHSTLAKSEQADYLVARLLSLAAVLRADIVKDESARLDLLQELLAVSQAKSYLLQPAVKLVVEHFVKEGQTERVLEMVGRTVSLSLSELSVDSLYLLLSLYKQDKAVVSEQVPQTVGVKKLFGKKALESFSSVLLGSSLPPYILAKHPLLPLLVQLLVEEQAVSKIWTFITPEMTVANNRGLVGWTLLREVGRAKASLVPSLLTRHTLSIGRQLASRQASLPLVKDVWDCLAGGAEKGEVDRMEVIKSLLEMDICWEKLSCGGLVGQLLGGAEVESVKEVGNIYLSSLRGGGRGEERVHSGGQLVKLVGLPQVRSDLAWRGEVMKGLAGVSVLTDVPGVEALTNSCKDHLRDVVFRALSSRNKTLEDSVSLLRDLVTYIQKQVKEGPTKTVKVLTPEQTEVVRVAEENITELERKWGEGKNKEVEVFLFLYYQMWLQMLSQPELATEVLDELQPVFTRWGEQQTKAEEPAWVEVVTEILLSLLAQNNVLLRGVVGSVFSGVCSHMTGAAIDSLLAVIKSKDGNPEEEDSDEESDDGEDEGENDEEENNGEDDENKAEDSDDSESEEESDNDENEDYLNDVKPVNTDLVKKVTDALGDHGDQSESEDEIDMDEVPDEDMAKLDQKLVEAFKQLGGRKDWLAKKKEKLSTLARTHFKLRVLDLVDLYLAHQPQAEHLVRIVPALVSSLDQAIRTPAQAEPLIKRLVLVLAKVASVPSSKLTVSPEVGETVVKVLEEFLQLASTGSVVVSSLGPTFSRLSTFLLRLGEVGGKEEQMEKLYLSALANWLEQSVCVLPREVFSLAMSHQWRGCAALATQLASSAFSPSVRMFRKVASVTLISELLSHKTLVRDLGDEVKDTVVSLAKNVIQQLEVVSENVGKVKHKYLMELFSILIRLRDLNFDQEVDWEKVGEVLASIAEKWPGAKHFIPAKRVLNKLGSKCKLQLKYSQCKQEIVRNTVDETSVKKKKNKKKTKEALQKAKALKHRMAEAQETVGVPSFTEFVSDNINDGVDAVDKPDSVKRKKTSALEDEAETPRKVKKKKKTKA